MSRRFNPLKRPTPYVVIIAVLASSSTLHAQLDIELDVSVMEVDGRFQYDYTLTNLITSSVGVNGFLMTVAQGADVNDMTGPDNWSPFFDGEEPNLQVVWLADAEEFDIQPEMDASFSLSSSYAPDSQDYFIAKFTEDFSDILGSVDGMTRAPTVPPETTLDCNGDGLINADDLACACGDEIRDELLVELNLIEGDFDGDGTVAFADFLALSSNFGQAVASYTDGDVDCNGMVEFADFLALSSNFGRASGGNAVPIPEPGALFLAGLAACGLAARRRRRDQHRWVGTRAREPRTTQD